MKFPLDLETMKDTIQGLAKHDQSQRDMIEKLSEIVKAAMLEDGAEDCDWYDEASELFTVSERDRIDNENRKFHENTLRMAEELKNPDSKRAVLREVKRPAKSSKKAELSEGERHHLLKSGDFNKLEADFGGEMDEDEIAAFFKEKPKKKVRAPNFANMSLDQIKEWERAQDNSNDIYKIAARVKNTARGSSLHLTPQGEALCNSFVHVAKSFYDFAERIPDKRTRDKLIDLVRSHESFPANVIAAAMANVKPSK